MTDEQNDIVERLRDDRLYAVRCNCSWPTKTREEAADEIERLRRRLDAYPPAPEWESRG